MPWPTTYPFFHVDQLEQVDNAALLRRLQRPEGPVDVVLDTDTYNEIDDQYALAYLIKNDEKLKLKAIYAAPFCNNKAATPAIGMQKSYDEIKNILSLMGRTDLLDCTYRGSESYLPDEKTPVESDAARHLAQLAMQYTPEKPLYVIAIAAITNVASALLMKPEIRDRIVLVWLGGNALHWHDNHEFNLFQDIAGARVALGCGAVLMKGGHLDDAESPDWLFTREGEQRFTTPRVQTKNTHGTGCTLSAALAALRPRHADWAATVAEAKAWLSAALAQADSLEVGHGIGPVHHFHAWW